MIKKIKVLILASLVVITLTSKAEESDPGLCKQLWIGFGGGCLIGTVPPLADNPYYPLQKLCTHYGAYSVGMSMGVSLGLYNWYNVGQAVSRKFFNSSRGRYISAIPALWLLSMNWKNNA